MNNNGEQSILPSAANIFCRTMDDDDPYNIYPIKYTHDFIVPPFILLWYQFIMDSLDVFIRTFRG